MEKKIYFEIVNLYKKEKNLNRLVYRLIKNEDTDLSIEQIANRVAKILYNVNLPELSERRFAEAVDISNQKVIKSLEERGYVDIKVKLGNINFKDKNGKSFFTFASVTEEYAKVKKELFEKYYKPVEEALTIVEKAGWIESYNDVKFYISPYTHRQKIKSEIIRFKAKK